jgi:hypothetical protein
MATKFMTPGVYIEEKDGFPGSVVAVETAIPAFIGYTEKASRNGKSLKNKPTRVGSLQEYVELFGGDFESKFSITPLDETNNESGTIINNKNYAIDYVAKNKALMSPSIKLFYANGGGACYIVSVGTYEGSNKLEIDSEELLGTKNIDNKVIEGGLVTLKKVQEPTMIVVPDAVNLESGDCYSLYVAVLKHCSEM